MKALKHFICAVAIILGVTGCFSPSKIRQDWVGRHESDLIASSWGPPTSTASDGKGGHILIYKSYADWGETSGTITPTGNGNYSYTAPKKNGYERIRMFYVDSKGTIYSFRWEGY